MLSDKNSIVLHHSLTDDGETVSWGAIRKFHVEMHGWREIGYHYGIERVGKHYEILVGRFLEEDAAAVKEQRMNRHGIHVCFIGNFDLAPPPPAQWLLGLHLVRSLTLQFSIPKDRIFGHRDFASYKSCPGTLFSLEQFRFDLNRF